VYSSRSTAGTGSQDLHDSHRWRWAGRHHPSLLVSVAGGIVVTHAASDYSLGSDIGKQMFRTARPLWIVSDVSCLWLSSRYAKDFVHCSWRCDDVCGLEDEALGRNRGGQRYQGRSRKGRQGGDTGVDPMDAVLKLDELMLEVGVGLVPLVDAKQGGQLLRA